MKTSGPAVESTASADAPTVIVAESRPPDTLRSGRYSRLGHIGQGGMGDVHKYWDEEIGREVAIKRMRAGHDDRLARRRFEKQMNALAAVIDYTDAVSPVHAFFEENGVPYLVTDFITGVSMAEALRQDDFTLERLLRVCLGVADGLAGLHSARVVHRDLKPANIMIRKRDDAVRIIDFGLAGLAADAAASDSRPPGLTDITQAGAVMGTPRYMAPEQAQGEHAARPMDIWSFGCLLGDVCRRFPEAAPTALRDLLDDCRHHRPEARPSAVEVRTRLAAIVAPTREAPALVNTVPRPVNTPVGREQEVETLRSMLSRRRLVTIWGLDGLGKTTLVQILLAAIQAAPRAEETAADGVCFVTLDGAVDVDDALRRIADAAPPAAGLRDARPEQLRELLPARLRGLDLWLILDAVDEHARPLAPIVRELLHGPTLRIIATGYQRFNLPEEQTYRIAGLREAEAPGVTALRASDAARLFVERARAHIPAFRIGRDNETAVRRICSGLQGVPLALELAATSLASMPLAELADRLGELARDRPGGMDASVRTALHGLTADQRERLRRLTVFRGGWTLDAAHAVDPPGPDNPLLDDLRLLTERSLIRFETDDAGGGRYAMLAPVRDALESLTTLHADEIDTARAAHASWFLALAERADQATTAAGEMDAAVRRRSSQTEWLRRLDEAAANINAAIEFTVGRLGADHAADDERTEAAERLARFVIALDFYWSRRGALQRGMELAERVEPHVASASLRIDLLNAMGIMAFEDQNWTASARWHRAALARAEPDAPPETIAKVCSNLGLAILHLGDIDDSIDWQRRALHAARRAGNRRQAHAVRLNLAAARKLRPDETAVVARRLRRLCRVFRRRFADRYRCMLTLRNLGEALFHADASASARAFRRALVYATALRDGRQAARAMRGLAALPIRAAPADRAALLAGARLADPGVDDMFDPRSSAAFRAAASAVSSLDVAAAHEALSAHPGGWRLVVDRTRRH